MTPPALVLDVGAFVRPCLGEVRAGDAAVVVRGAERVFVALVDVVGHGDEAHAVARRLEAALEARWADDLPATLRALHEELRPGGRGAAVCLVRVDLATGALRYVGVGNTRARALRGAPLGLASQDGAVGGALPTPREQRATLAAGQVLALFTDGVSERFDPAADPTLASGDAAAVARKVVHRHGKTHDDAACIALRVA